MKHLKIIIASLAVLALTVTANAQLGAPQTILSYTTGSAGGYYSIGGTNNNTGYTNTPVLVDITKGTLVNFMFHHASSEADTNTKILVIKSAYSSSASKIATPTIALGNQVARITFAASTTAGVTVTTNLASWGSPYITVAVESLPDVGCTTNLTLSTYVKAN
jgi:hypothetical protein